MKYIIKQLLREHLLLEGQAYPFQQTEKNDNGIQYEFTADNIPYIVTLITNEQKEIYELGFNVAGAEDAAHRTKKDLTHLNNVLATVDDIVKKAVHDYRIKKIAFSGAREETDSQAIFLKSLRDKTYLRYLKQHHPNAVIDNDRQGSSYIVMKSIYPEVFEKNKDEKDILIDLLMQISDEDPDEDYFVRNISFNEYTNKIQCDIDGILNSKLGRAEIQIDYDYDYMVTINILDSDETFQEKFKTFNEVLEFIKKTFSDEKGDTPLFRIVRILSQSLNTNYPIASKGKNDTQNDFSITTTTFEKENKNFEFVIIVDTEGELYAAALLPENYGDQIPLTKFKRFDTLEELEDYLKF